MTTIADNLENQILRLVSHKVSWTLYKLSPPEQATIRLKFPMSEAQICSWCETLHKRNKRYNCYK